MSDLDSAPLQSASAVKKKMSSDGGGRLNVVSGRPHDGFVGMTTRRASKAKLDALISEETPPATNVTSFWEPKGKNSVKKKTPQGKPAVFSDSKYGIAEDSDVSGSESYSSSGGSFRSLWTAGGGSVLKEQMARPESYVDLTGLHCCRAYMKKTVAKGPTFVAAVCGLTIHECSRRGHESKRAKGARGNPAFYFKCYTARGSVDEKPDGRADLPTKTSSELADMAANIRKLVSESVAALNKSQDDDSLVDGVMSTVAPDDSIRSADDVKNLFSPMENVSSVGPDDDSTLNPNVPPEEPPALFVGEVSIMEEEIIFEKVESLDGPANTTVKKEDDDSVLSIKPQLPARSGEKVGDTNDSILSSKLPFQSPGRSPKEIAKLLVDPEKSGEKDYASSEVYKAETSGVSNRKRVLSVSEDVSTGASNHVGLNRPPPNPTSEISGPPKATSKTKKITSAPLAPMKPPSTSPSAVFPPSIPLAPNPPPSKPGTWVGLVHKQTRARRVEFIQGGIEGKGLNGIGTIEEDVVVLFSSAEEALQWLQDGDKKPPAAPRKTKEKKRAPTPHPPHNDNVYNDPTSNDQPTLQQDGPAPFQMGLSSTNTLAYESETSMGSGQSATKRVGFQTPVPTVSSSPLWYGLTFKASGQRIIVASTHEVSLLCHGSPPQAEMTRVFTQYKEALAWSLNGKDKKKKEKKKRQGHPSFDPPSSSSSSNSGSSSEDDSSNSSSSSSSFNWDDDSSTESGSSIERGASKRRSSSKHKGRQHNSERKGPKPNKGKKKDGGVSKDRFREKVLAERFQGDDPSVGKDDEIYGENVADERKLNKVLCPPDLTKEDRVKFLQLTPDVTSLPGMYLSSSVDTSMEFEMVSLSLANNGSRRNTALHDSFWRHKKKHSLGAVKTQEDLISMVEQVDKASKVALNQFKERVRSFMLYRHYSKSSITLYLQAGLLPKIVHLTVRNFQLLLESLRSLTYKFGFDEGPAKHLLSIHADSLGEKRYFAHDYRSLVLGSYVWLREARNKDFASGNLLTAVWDQINKPVRPSNLPGTRTQPRAMCSHCKSKTLHEGGKSSCDLKDLPPTKAKAAAKEILSALEKDKSLDRAKVISDAIKKAKQSE